MSIWFRIALISFILVLISVEAVNYFVSEEFSEEIRRQNGEKLKAIAVLMADAIDGDVYQKIRDDAASDSIRDSSAFLQVRSTIRGLREKVGLSEEIYTLDLVNENIATFGVMSNMEPFIGDTLHLISKTAKETLNKVYRTGQPAYTDLYVDQYGHWMSAIAPILNSKGELVSVLQVDHESSFIDTILDRFHRELLWMRLLLLPVIALLTLIASRYISNPIKHVTEAIVKISEGEYTYPLKLESSGEVRKLILSTKKMKEKILRQQEKIRNYVMHLEELVDERTSEIREQKEEIEHKNTALEKQNNEILRQQEILERQAKKITETNKELKLQIATKDKFFSIIAHDLKNPLAGLLGYSKILSEQFPELDLQKKLNYINIMNRLTKNTHSLLENLLSWARTQLGGLELHPEKYCVKQLCDSVISLLQPAAEKKQITLDTSGIKENGVIADRQTVSTIIRNLITNAIKFTAQGGKVTVFTEKRDEFIYVSISDTGIGMSREELNKLFKIDVNFSKTGTANEKGTGLGLILCKEFIEKNGGNISVESIQGTGTTFTFNLPANQEQTCVNGEETEPKTLEAHTNYDEDAGENSPAVDEYELPDKELLQKMKQAARMGDIKELRTLYDTIKRDENHYPRLAQKLSSLLAEFDTQQIVTLTEKLLRRFH